MTIFLVVAVVAIAVGGFFLYRRNASTATALPRPESAMANPLDPANLFIATSSESAARASKVLPNGPSENARHVLGSPPASTVGHDRGDSDDRDYAPNPHAEWAVHVDFRDGVTARKQQILSVLSPEWLRANASPTVYGFSPETNHWTYVNAADVPDVYSKLQVAWRYLPLDPGTSFRVDAVQRWLRALESAAPRIAPATVRPSEPPAAAERRARDLESLRSDLEDAEIMIGLVAPEGRPFEGRAMWDALTSLGLEWGDGDLFHWVNPNRDAGDDSLFSVSTSTEPGYFFPEEAVAGRMHVEDLTFSFPIPRTHEPTVILEAMIRAAKYVQRRLGGTLVSAPADEALNEAALRTSLGRIVQRMNAAGISPGSDEALHLF